jgi:diguanylate cyclase (GGDEF)-like protein
MRLTEASIHTRGQIWRALIVLTLLSIVFSVVLSVLALYFTTTGEPGALVTESDVWFNVILFAVLVPGTICPIVVYQLLTTLRDLNLARAELDAIAKGDALTGLLNRRGFDEAATALIGEAKATGQVVAAIMCDIDLFKRINDTYGHECGDEAIRHVAAVLKSIAATLPRAVAGRQGGEEFALIISDMPRRELAGLAETIRLTVESAPFRWEGSLIPVTISLGTSWARPDEAALKPLMVSADHALYEAKKRGRNRVEVAALLEAA